MRGEESDMEGWDRVVVGNDEGNDEFRGGDNNEINRGSWSVEEKEDSDVDLDMLVAVWF